MKSTTRFKQNVRGIECLNCKRPLSDKDNFCPNCGQVNDELPLSIKQFISEFFSGFFSFDTRFFNTFIPLLFKPGKVSKDYIKGKRRRYVNPFQLYLHITIVFFLLQGIFLVFDEYKISSSFSKNNTQATIDSIQENLPVITNNDSINKETTDTVISNIVEISEEEEEEEEEEELKKLVGNQFFKKISNFMKYGKENEKASVVEALDNQGYEKTRWNVFYYRKAQDLNKFKNDSEYRSSYLDAVISKISIALFFMLPIFTWFISLLYFRHKKNYTEHLVFVFNVQTVFFILLIFFILFDKVFKTDIGIGAFIIVFLFYLYKSLRNFYKQNRFKTIVKYFILNTIFIILSTIGGVIISFLSFIL